MKIAIVSQYYTPEAVPHPSRPRCWPERARPLRAGAHRLSELPDRTVVPRLSAETRRTSRMTARRQCAASRSSSATRPMSSGGCSTTLSFGAERARWRGRHVRGADVVYVYATPDDRRDRARASGVWTVALPSYCTCRMCGPSRSSARISSSRAPRSPLIAPCSTPWLRHLYRASAATIAIAPTMAKTLDRSRPPAVAEPHRLQLGKRAVDARPRDHAETLGCVHCHVRGEHRRAPGPRDSRAGSPCRERPDRVPLVFRGSGVAPAAAAGARREQLGRDQRSVRGSVSGPTGSPRLYARVRLSARSPARPSDLPTARSRRSSRRALRSASRSSPQSGAMSKALVRRQPARIHGGT